MADVPMPQLGETVTEGTITQWFKQVGDAVAVDEVLFEVSTDKVDSEVPSPVAGVVTEILVPEGDTVDVGTVLARVGTASDAPATGPAEPEPVVAPAPPAPVPTTPAPAAPAPAPAAPAPAPAPVSASETEGRLLSPVVRRLIAEHDIDVASIAGTGVGGRITRNDVLAVIDSGGSRAAAASAPAPAAPAPAPAAAPAAAAPAATPAAPPAAAPTPVVSVPAVPVAPGSAVIAPFNNIRRKTGEYMLASLAASPHVLTVQEVDYENVDSVRRKMKAEWRASEGFSLTYLPFQVRAVIEALSEYPDVNAQVEDDHLVVFRDVHLGIAVDLNFQGLLVPVIKNADTRNLRGIAREISDLAARARTKKLGMDDITGGTFTISNNGSFGSFVSSPIINQPQVAILSTDGVSRRPVVVEDAFGNEVVSIHSVGNLSLSFDHRAFDGAYGASFLRRVKEILETRDWANEF